MVADRTNLAELKRRVSTRLLDEKGVSGVGIRGRGLVAYLETDDPQVRARAEAVVREIAPTALLAFEVAGAFGKQ